MVHNVHDYGYRKLFSNATIFRQLLETFVNQDWIKDIDFSSAIPLNRSFISNEYKERETDLVYQVKIKDKEAFICILIEFQSNVQKFMAVRILHYISSFYIYYIENNNNVKKLPPIFPILLYNGDNNWSAPNNINDLIDNNISLGDYNLNFKYFPIAENSFSKDFLLKANNIVSTLFLTEVYSKNDNLLNIDLLRDAFSNLFDKEEDRIAMSIFFNWYEQFYINERLTSEGFNAIEKVYTNKSEVNSMLATTLEKQKEVFRVEGRLEGRLEGKIEGILEAKIIMVKKLKELNMPLEQISTVTELSVEEIEKI